MKRLLIAAALLGSTGFLYAQQPTSEKQNEYAGKTFTKVTDPASFPGGTDSLNRYVKTHGHFPKKIGTLNIFAYIHIDTTGKATAVQVINDTDKDYEAELSRIIKTAPHWTPAAINGVPVLYRHKQKITIVYP